MNAKEGMTRIAKLTSVVGWLAFSGFVLSAISNLSGQADWGMFFVLLFLAVVALACFQGLVWVFDGFAGNKKADGALLWPLRPNKNRLAQRDPKPLSSKPLLIGVHGWLFFFVLILLVVSPLRILVELMSSLTEAEKLYPQLLAMQDWKDYKMASWLIAIIVSGSIAFAGYSLLRHHHPSSVGITYCVLWVAPPASLILDFWASTQYLQMGSGQYMHADVYASLGQSLVFAIVWTAYLKRSRRVKITYYGALRSNLKGEPVRSEPTL